MEWLTLLTASLSLGVHCGALFEVYLSRKIATTRSTDFFILGLLGMGGRRVTAVTSADTTPHIDLVVYLDRGLLPLGISCAMWFGMHLQRRWLEHLKGRGIHG